MKFFGAAIFALALGQVQAAAIPNTSAVEAADNVITARANGRCQNLSTFVDKTSTATAKGPMVKDCNRLYSRINKIDASQHINPTADGVWGLTLTEGTCKLVISTKSSYGVDVGNSDIAWWISQSVQKFAKDRRVASEGASACWSG